MTITTTQDALNRNNSTRRIDQFYATFLKIPENISNLLGKQTKTITRPSFRFETSETSNRRNQRTHMAQLRFDSIELVLFDDHDGLTHQAIMTQIFRQLNEGKDLYGNWGDYNDRDYRFDLRIDLFDSHAKVKDGFILKNCFISNVRYSDLSYSDEETRGEIRMTITFDNIDVWIVDKYVSAKISS